MKIVTIILTMLIGAMIVETSEIAIGKKDKDIAKSYKMQTKNNIAIISVYRKSNGDYGVWQDTDKNKELRKL